MRNRALKLKQSPHHIHLYETHIRSGVASDILIAREHIHSGAVSGGGALAKFEWNVKKSNLAKFLYESKFELQYIHRTVVKTNSAKQIFHVLSFHGRARLSGYEYTDRNKPFMR